MNATTTYPRTTADTEYDPRSRKDRVKLATMILGSLEGSGMEEMDRSKLPYRCYERVFYRETSDPNVRVFVYTSIEGSEMRAVGSDAIRAAAVYKAQDGKMRGLASAEKRVNRTGTFGAIVDRMLDRIIEVSERVDVASRCYKCGAPHFKSKKGNLVCADLCWTH